MQLLEELEILPCIQFILWIHETKVQQNMRILQTNWQRYMLYKYAYILFTYIPYIIYYIHIFLTFVSDELNRRYCFWPV